MIKSNKIFIVLTIVLMFVLMMPACRKSESSEIYLYDEDTNKNEEKSSDCESEILEETSKLIYVQITGAINSPGVYELKEGLRIFEVIEMAGGTLDNACTDAINMARPVKDEMVIYVPTKEEVDKGFLEETSYAYEDYTLEENSSQTKININTATLEQLMELPGIGETKANQIIDYRTEKGGFKSIDEIMNISGIKQSSYDKIKDMIEV